MCVCMGAAILILTGNWLAGFWCTHSCDLAPLINSVLGPSTIYEKWKIFNRNVNSVNQTYIIALLSLSSKHTLHK